MKQRLDALLVERGLVETRAKAQALVLAGKVFSGEKRLDKAGMQVAPDLALEVRGQDHPWVSRGGVKLDFALNHFALSPLGLVCLDIGASTGGFTEVLLHRGAARVYAVDVGRDQLHDSLKSDLRITSLEATDARVLTRAEIPESPSLIVCDASFISLAKVLGVPLSLASDDAEVIALFKPQFEVGRDFIGKGGIVRPDAPVADALEAFARWLEGQGWQVTAHMPSPVTGGDGNLEYLVHAFKRRG